MQNQIYSDANISEIISLEAGMQRTTSMCRPVEFGEPTLPLTSHEWPCLIISNWLHTHTSLSETTKLLQSNEKQQI